MHNVSPSLRKLNQEEIGPFKQDKNWDLFLKGKAKT